MHLHVAWKGLNLVDLQKEINRKNWDTGRIPSHSICEPPQEHDGERTSSVGNPSDKNVVEKKWAEVIRFLALVNYPINHKAFCSKAHLISRYPSRTRATF